MEKYDILADVCGDRSGKVKVTLKEKKLSDFEQVRVLLAGGKKSGNLYSACNGCTERL